MSTIIMPSKAKITLRKSRLGAARDELKKASVISALEKKSGELRYQKAKSNYDTELKMARDYYKKRKSSQK